MFSKGFRLLYRLALRIIFDWWKIDSKAGFSTVWYSGAVEKSNFSKLVRIDSNHLSIMPDDVFEFPTRLATGNIISIEKSTWKLVFRQYRRGCRKIQLFQDRLASLKKCKTNFSDVFFFLACRSTAATRVVQCTCMYFSVFFPPAFVESQMAQMDRLRILERVVLGSSSLCCRPFVAVFTFFPFKVRT